MQAFELLVQDDRYTVPSWLFVEARSHDHARAIARRHLRSSDHYSGVEVYRDETRLFVLHKPANIAA